MANENVDGSLSFKASIAVETDKLVRSFQKVKSIVTSVFKDMQGAATRAYTQMDKDLQRSRTEVGTLQEKLEQQVKLLNELRSGLSGNKYKAFSGLGAIKEAEKEYRNLIEQLALAEQEMQEYGHRIHAVENESQTPIVNGTKKLDSMIQKYRELLIQKNELDRQGYTTGDAPYDKTVNQIARLGEAIERYKQKLLSADTTSKESTNHTSAFRRILIRLRFALNGVASAFTRAFSKTRTRLINAAESATAKFANNLKSKLTPSFNKSGRSLKKLTRLLIKYIFGVRSFFFLYRRIRKSVSEGLGSLVLVDDRTNRSISDFKTALNTLRGALASAFSPIINVVAPILTRFINLLTTVTDSIGMFIAYLTGQKTYYKAASVYQDYAESLQDEADAASDAAKANKEYLSGLDEIRKWDSGNDSGGSGSGGGGGNDATQGLTWEEVEIPQSIKNLADSLKEYFENQDWDALGKVIAEKINGVFDKLYELVNWDNIGPKITPVINGITSTFNSLVDNINWTKIGQTLGAGINTIVNSLDLLLTGVDWNNLGSKVAQGIKGLFTEIEWEKLGKTIADGLNVAISAMNGFIQEMDKIDVSTMLTGWETVGKSLGDTINGLVDNVKWDELGQNISGGIAGALSTLSTAIDTVDWSKLSTGIVDTITNFDAADVGNKVSGFFNSLTDALVEFDAYEVGKSIKEKIKEVNWGEVVSSIFEALGAAIGSIGSFIAGVFGDIPGAIKNYFVEKIKAAGWDEDNDLLENGKAILVGILNGIVEALKNIGQWIYDNILVPFVNGIKKTFDINSPAKEKTLVDAAKEIGWGILQAIANVFKSIGTWVKENILKPLVEAIEKFVNGAVNFVVGVKDTSKEWWQNVKTWWAEKVEAVKSFTTNVKNQAKTWWHNVKTWWANKVSNVKSFTTNVKNQAKTWWGNVKVWWGARVSNVKSFTTNVKNQAKTWWSNTKTWWSEKVGSVHSFMTNVANHSGTWWHNVKTWWSEVTDGKTVSDIVANMADKSAVWWANVKAWWANTIYGKTLSSVAASIRDSTTTWWNNVKSWWSTTIYGQTLSEVIANIKNTVSSWWESIKSWWNNYMSDKSLSVDVNARIGGKPELASGGQILSNGKVEYYAGGTTKAHGTAFIAGEAGPEIVGHIGGKTEVLNRSQLASTMYSAVSAGVGFILEKFGDWLSTQMAMNTNALIASQEAILSRVSIPAIARGSALPANSTFMSAINGGLSGSATAGLSEQDLRRIVREESGGRGANYEFVAQINRRTLFDEFIQEARLRQMQTGKNPFEFA